MNSNINRENAERYVQVHTQFLEKFNFRSESKIIDVGCGDGIFFRRFISLPNIRRVVGLDIDEEHCFTARKLNPGTKVVRGDAMNIPFKAKGFDLVFVNSVLHHVSNYRNVLNELVRICNRGGRIIIVEPRRYHPAIFLLSMLKIEERCQLSLNLGKLKQVITNTTGLILEQSLPINSFIYPYQKFPPRRLFKLFALFEDFLNIPILSTHQAFIIKKTK